MRDTRIYFADMGLTGISSGDDILMLSNDARLRSHVIVVNEEVFLKDEVAGCPPPGA